MSIETIFPGAGIASADRQEEPRRSTAGDSARVERFFLVTVGLVAGLEIGLLVLWLLG